MSTVQHLDMGGGGGVTYDLFVVVVENNPIARLKLQNSYDYT